MMRGKIPAEKLKKLVLPYLGASNENIIIPPQVGEDAAVVAIGEEYLVAASDPITGAIKNIGMYTVNINANDVACMGAAPQYFLSVILVPQGCTDHQLQQIAFDISKEAESLGIAIIGGHTEVLPIKEPIVVGTMMGVTERVITSAGAELGDHIILTKGAAIEGTSILATDFYDILQKKVDINTLEKAKMFLREISVVKEALLAKEYATAMHDPTEGGIVGALHELADASQKGFTVDTNKIFVLPETEKICSALDINPLYLISSGSLLMTVPPDLSHTLLKKLQTAGIASEIIGEITEGRNLDPADQDELWRILDKFAP